MKIRHVRDYAEARREDYPDIGDQLDAIWAVLKTQNLPKETRDLLDRVEAVKRKYPKPKTKEI
jgi:hypothetical protein